jgi:hypothetical protein
MVGSFRFVVKRNFGGAFHLASTISKSRHLLQIACPPLKCGLRVSDQEQESGNNILSVTCRCVNFRPGQYSNRFYRT